MTSLARSLPWITAWLALVAAPAGAQSFHFVVLGDRTGEAQPGVYEEAWKEAAGENPALVVTVGDTIQGLNDATADREWRAIEQMLESYRRIPFYPAPGNHDIWSPASEKLFLQYTGHEVHYSFDYQQAHFTILDNSRSEQLTPDELAFLERDLQAHSAQPVKFIVSHRPSWLIDAVVRNPNFALHRLAKISSQAMCRPTCARRSQCERRRTRACKGFTVCPSALKDAHRPNWNGRERTLVRIDFGLSAVPRIW